MQPSFMRLTCTEHRVWTFIADYWLAERRSPGYLDVVAGTGLSMFLVRRALDGLRRKGYIQDSPYRTPNGYRPARSLKLLVWPARVAILHEGVKDGR
jgi:hypothetical protein